MSDTVADLILKQLAAYGVKTIYGVIGDAIFPLGNALAHQEQIKFIPATIETTAAFMASYGAKLTGTLGVCIGTSGPGAANLVNGVADAYLDNAPVLCITGQVPSDKIGTLEKQYINQTELFAPITTLSLQCVNPQSIIPILTHLINEALTQQTAVHLEIPQDILSTQTSAIPALVPEWMPDFNGTKFLSGQFQPLLELMAKSEKPTLVMGKQACSIWKNLAALAESFGAALVVGRECKGAIPDDYPQVIGGIGEAFLPECFKETDLLIIFGEAVYEERFFPGNIPIIQFRNSSRLGANKYLGVSGDFYLILQEIRKKFPEYISRAEWRSKIETSHQARVSAYEAEVNPKHPLHFFHWLAQVIDEQATITLDVGEFVYWFDLGFLAKHQKIILSTNWRSMGGGIPAAIAVAHEYPHKQIISIAGDGGFLMSMAELTTIQRFHLPITIFVMQNQCYGLEIQKMRQLGLANFATDLIVPDLKKLAESFGLNYFHFSEIQNQPHPADLFRNIPTLVKVEVDSATLPNL